LGVDRVLELARGVGLKDVGPSLDAYAIVTDVSSLPLVLFTLRALREVGVSVQMHASTGDGMGSMKSQFKRADSSGARFALIFGHDEVAAHQVTVKPLRDANAPQQTRSIDEIATWATTLQSAA
jgi:histidyl-tRNA synthetase